MNENTLPLNLAKAACDTMMNKFKTANLPPEGWFHYHAGVLLSGFEQTLINSGDRRYADYIKMWLDRYIDENGNVSCYSQVTLDDKQPGILLFRLIEENAGEQYEKALKYIKSGIDTWKVNSLGGFWHKDEEGIENQMWLDGLYMAGELITRYGAKYNDEACFDLVYKQASLMWENIRDLKTGLLYHAWDESKVVDWCDKETGLSSYFWGRAAGWYIVALTTILKYLPKDNCHREKLIGYTREYIKAFTVFQDEKSGLWYQIIDKGDRADNWLETSCTALFLCGISMAIKQGVIDESYRENADKAYKGLLSKITENENGIVLPDICIGTGVGSYEYYIERPRTQNDLHGMGSLILACNAYHEIC